MRHSVVTMYIGKDVGRGFFFTFTKDTVRRKAWTIFSKREAFVPTKNHRLCSDRFTRDQIQRDPAQLEPYGYDGARIRLKPDAVPDVPLQIKSENKVVLPPRPRGAYMKTVSNFLVYNVILFCCFMLLFMGNGPLVCRSFTKLCSSLYIELTFLFYSYTRYNDRILISDKITRSYLISFAKSGWHIKGRIVGVEAEDKP